jgi:hypothetical protein
VPEEWETALIVEMWSHPKKAYVSLSHYPDNYCTCSLFWLAAAETRSDVPSASGVPKCAICLTEPRNTALLCGHQLCWDCAQRVDHCPVCRKFITHRIQLFWKLLVLFCFSSLIRSITCPYKAIIIINIVYDQGQWLFQNHRYARKWPGNDW